MNSSEPAPAVPPATTAPAAAPVAPGYQRQTSQPKDYGNCQLILFLEVDLQRSTYIVFAFVVLHSRGGPGSWLMHFPYVVLHGCFGFF